jgi:hypothetical protein
MDFKVTYLDGGLGALTCVDKSPTVDRMDRTPELTSKPNKLRKTKSDNKCPSVTGSESPAMQCNSSGSLRSPGFPLSSSSSTSSCASTASAAAAAAAAAASAAAAATVAATHLTGSALSYDHTLNAGHSSYHPNLIGSSHNGTMATGSSSSSGIGATAAVSNQSYTPGFSDYYPAFGQTAPLQSSAMAVAAVAAAHPAAYPANLAAAAAAYSYSANTAPAQVTIINNNYNLNLNQQLNHSSQSSVRETTTTTNGPTRKCKSSRGSSTSPNHASTPVAQQPLLDTSESTANAYSSTNSGFGTSSLLSNNFSTGSHHHWLSCYPPDSNQSIAVDTTNQITSGEPTHSSSILNGSSGSLSSGSGCSSASASSNGTAASNYSSAYGSAAAAAAAASHPLLHYSRFSSYYHSDYHHLYNYLEPKLKNGQLIANPLLGNQLISGQLLGNQFLNSPLLSTNSSPTVAPTVGSMNAPCSIEPTSGCSSPSKSACSNENDKSIDSNHQLRADSISSFTALSMSNGANCRSPSSVAYPSSASGRLDRQIRSAATSSYYSANFHSPPNSAISPLTSGLTGGTGLAVSCKFSEQPKLSAAMPVSPMEVSDD